MLTSTDLLRKLRIKYEEANSPEYYSQFGEVKDALIQLTGDKTVVDLSGYEEQREALLARL